MDELCSRAGGFKLQEHQEFLKQYFPNINRILLYHGLGSGKTCTAISMASAYVKNSGPRFKKVIVVTPASLRENFYKELMSECGSTQISKIAASVRRRGRVMRETASKPVCEMSSRDKGMVREYIAETKREIDKIFDIVSYQGFVKYIKTNQNINNRLIIVDEVQNIISATGDTYKTIRKALHKPGFNSRVVFLSGTPMFDNPFELSLLGQLLQTPEEFARVHLSTDPKIFDRNHLIVDGEVSGKDRVYNVFNRKVSYISGADRRAYPETVEHEVNCRMSEYQAAVYQKSIGKLNLSSSNKPMSRTFLIGPRQVSNMVMSSGKRIQANFNVAKHSTKFAKCIQNITSKPNFVYSNFVSVAGTDAFAEILEKVMKYTRIGKDVCPLKKGDRFAMFKSGEPDENSRILKIFNSPENRNGDLIRIMIGSPAMKEGVTLLNVRRVHILDPYWNRSRTDQIIGRAVRYCSHTILPPSERRVDVYHYYAVESDAGSERSVDRHVRFLSDGKEERIRLFNKLLKQVAVDCKTSNKNTECVNMNNVKTPSANNDKLPSYQSPKPNNSPVNTSIMVNSNGNNRVGGGNANKPVSSPKKPAGPRKAWMSGKRGGGTGVVGARRGKLRSKGCPRARQPLEDGSGCDPSGKYPYIRSNPRGYPCCYARNALKPCHRKYTWDELRQMASAKKLDTRGTKVELCARLNL